MSSNENTAPADYYESDQYVRDMAYESATGGSHDCTGCGAEHEGPDNMCSACEAGTCCTTYPGRRLADDEVDPWADVDPVHRDCAIAAEELRATLAAKTRELELADREIEERGNEAVYYREERDEAQAALKTADDRVTDTESTLMRIDEFIDRPWKVGAYGPLAEDGYIHALRAMRRRDRIRTALIVGPVAALIGAAAALAAAVLS